MVVGERLEQPERLERARRRRRGVLDPGAREGVLEHGQVESDVVGDEDRVTEKRPELARDVGERRRICDVRGAIPCTAVASAGISPVGLTSRVYRPVSPPSGSSCSRASETISSRVVSVPVVSQSNTAYPVGIGAELRDEAVPGRSPSWLDRSRREEIEDELHGHLSRMSSGSDVTLTMT